MPIDETSRAVDAIRCDEVQAWPVGQGIDLLYSPRTHRALQVSTDISRLLFHCRTFKTLQQHVESCRQEFRVEPDKVELIREALAELAAQEFFLSKNAFLDRVLGRLIPDEKPLHIEAVGILTHDRAGALEGCLGSYIQNAKAFGRSPDFIVMNDSKDPAIERQYKDRLQSLKPAWGVSLFYAGITEKTAFAKELIRETGIDPEIVHFALFDTENCGYSEGTNRNGLFLDTVGQGIFSADDDTLCQIAAIPGGRAGLDLVSAYDPTQLRLYPSHKTAKESVAFVQEDILALHERLLGKEIVRLIAAQGKDEVNLDPASPRFLRELEEHPGRVRVSWTGILGDSGFSFPSFCLSLKGPARELLLKDEEHYRRSYRSRQVLRGVDRATISDGPYCQSTFLAFDNRDCLPPFMPVQRGLDILFGAILRTCLKEAYVGYVPRALLHVPVTQRENTVEDIWRPAGLINFYGVMGWAISTFRPGPDPRDGIATVCALGKHLMDVGRWPALDFREFLRRHLIQQASEKIRQYEQLLQSYHETPGFWAQDIKKYIEVLRDAVTEPDYILPIDLRPDGKPEERLQLTQRLIFKLGRLLEAWPILTEVAAALRKKGLRLSKPL